VYAVGHIDQVIAGCSHKIRRKLDRTTFTRCQAEEFETLSNAIIHFNTCLYTEITTPY